MNTRGNNDLKDGKIEIPMGITSRSYRNDKLNSKLVAMEKKLKNIKEKIKFIQDEHWKLESFKKHCTSVVDQKVYNRKTEFCGGMERVYNIIQVNSSNGYKNLNGSDEAEAYLRQTPNISTTSSLDDEKEGKKDLIYSDVASLISQNEQHPHYLIAIFSLLNFFNSDLLRKQALFVLENIAAHQDSSSVGVREVYKSEKRNKKLKYSANSNVDTSKNHEENGSVISSSTSDGDDPFCRDGLQETAIHLREALSEMTEEVNAKIRKEKGNNLETVHGWLLERMRKSKNMILTDEVICEIIQKMTLMLGSANEDHSHLSIVLKKYRGHRLSAVHCDLVNLIFHEYNKQNGTTNALLECSGNCTEVNRVCEVEDGKGRFMSLRLAPSEAKPCSRIGSDEDAMDELDGVGFADSCETAVSLLHDGHVQWQM